MTSTTVKVQVSPLLYTQSFDTKHLLCYQHFNANKFLPLAQSPEVQVMSLSLASPVPVLGNRVGACGRAVSIH